MTLTDRQRQAIAQAAERLSHLVGSCPDRHKPLDADCPFCADETAYEGLLAAFPNVVKRTSEPKGESLPLGDISRRLQFNPDPIKTTRTPECISCRKRAPWCSCGRADYR